MILGVITAWRARKRDHPLAWRYGRRLHSASRGWSACTSSCSRSRSRTASPTWPGWETLNGNLGAPHKEVSFEASDGLRLDGWFVRSKNGAVVIVYPGKKGTQNHARMLVRHGYGVLVFDRRGEGTSEGDPNALGWGFDDDLKGALAYLRSRGVDPDRIGGLGLSVGGEALLQTAGETSAVKAVVSEGAGARSVREDTVHVSASKLPEIWFSGVMTARNGSFRTVSHRRT